MPIRDLENEENLAREYRINFAGELSPSEWPERHRSTFEAIQELSKKTFESYANNSGTNEEPWKVELKLLASKVREQARRSSHRNESSWRFACEPVILSRISSEVCCQNCRKRLWRSEIEVVREDNSHAAANLRRRQEAREPCRCPRVTRSRDILEATGLNPIFHYRADEEIHHDKSIGERLDHRQRPDRIYGLRQTRNIENLIYDAAERRFQAPDGQVTKQVCEVIELDQPLTQTGDRLLFPFLVLEAKSSNAGDSWHSIQMQTAFPIRTLLDAQDRLRKAAGSFSKWQFGPLVWFLANKGEDWRLSMCYPEAVPSKPHTIGTTEYRIVDVWRGSINSLDGALQLLLLVDYIFDWARDKYRNDIITELRVLASGDNDTASALYVDSDIYSTLQIDSRNYLDEEIPEVDGSEAVVSAQEAFNYDTPSGVVRHAAFVDSRFYGILVTKDNVQMLIRSTEKNKVGDLCGIIIDLVKDNGLMVEASDIDDIEWRWTGTRHAGWAYRHQSHPPYYALLSFCTYLDSKWHILRELCVIAIALDAWADIVEASCYPSHEKPELVGWSIGPSMASDKLACAVRRLQAGSPRYLLLAAINRRSIRLTVKKATGNISIKNDLVDARRVFHFVYLSAKRGVVEPQEPFIRISKRLSQQNLSNSIEEPIFRNTAIISDEACVLVTGRSVPPEEDKLRRNFCVYLTGDGDIRRPPSERLSLIVKTAYETRDVYHTTRNHGLSTKPTLIAPSIEELMHVWNLKKTYGVHSQSFGFVNLLQRLGGTPPITQGSARISSESGRQQYQRNWAPWQDRRYKPTYTEQRKFVLYKIFSQEIAFWRSVAASRRAEGLNCCGCCATPGPIDVCEFCQGILDDPNRYTWMKRCLKGEAPFHLTKPSADEMRRKLWFFQEYPGIKAFNMHRGAVEGNDDDDWARLLDFYPRLNEPFEDIRQLVNQWHDYLDYCGRGRRYGHKRKRSRGGESYAESSDSSF